SVAEVKAREQSPYLVRATITENDWTRANPDRLIPSSGLRVRCRNPNFQHGKWRNILVDSQAALQETM
ncbi:unnamed protein product, partial [Amoebophrya sp. A25]